MSTEFDVNSTCRICLGEYSKMYSLFSAMNANTYAEVFTSCTNIRIEENDGFPIVICEWCVKDMSQAHDFISKCKESDKRLRSSVKIESDIIIKDEDDIPIEDYYFKEEDDNHSFEDTKIDDDYDNDEDLNDDRKCDDRNIVDTSLKISKKKRKSKKLPKLIAKKRGPKKKGNKGPFKCSHCGFILQTNSSLIIHIRSHTGERPFQCSECPKAFRDKGTLREHFSRWHTVMERNFTCEDCGKSYKSKRDLRSHAKSHSVGVVRYQCSQCPKSFTHSSSLGIHLKAHAGVRPFPCNVCGKRFLRANHLQGHMAVHLTEKNFTCAICGISFKSKLYLKHHQQAVHIDRKTFICDQCGLSYTTKGNLRTHLLKSHSEESGLCHICNKRFPKLEDHVRVHSGERPFQCTLCKKTFAEKKRLASHMTKHRNAEKYPCTFDRCTKKFPRQSMLDFHILKIHKKYTPHICSLCGRGFFRRCDLKLHHFKSHRNVVMDIK